MLKKISIFIFNAFFLFEPQNCIAQSYEVTQPCLAQWIRDLQEPNLSASIRNEREQALRAREKFCGEQAAMSAREQRAPYPQSEGNNSSTTQDKSLSYECRQALRNLDVAQGSITNKNSVPGAIASVNVACGQGMAAGAYSPPRTNPATHRQIILASCDPGGCWDTVGVRYNRGGGGIFFRQDGQACQLIPGGMLCR